MDLIEKFKKYVSFDTTSSENVKKDKASTDSQYALSEELASELTALGGQNVHVNKFGTVYGFFPGQLKKDPIALIAHIDTSPSASGKDIKPRLIKGYDGKDIELSKGIVMKVADFPTLKDQKGDDLIVTDGTTLLGADDKAGIAIIMDLIDGFVSSSTPQSGKSTPQSASCSTSHSFANASQSHSPKPTLSFITNSCRFSSVHSSANITHSSGISLYFNSCNAFNLMFPPNGKSLPSTSVTQTIGRFSIISGNSCNDLTSFLNLSSLMIRGFFGFSFRSDIFISSNFFLIFFFAVKYSLYFLTVLYLYIY